MRAQPSKYSGALKKLSILLRSTPLHPQWFVFRGQPAMLRNICGNLDGLVADIGCADSKPRKYIPPTVDYIGIDYYKTASDWYLTKPDLYANAQALAIRSDSINHALLLDVLEHIPDPDKCLSEIFRILKPAGSLTIQVPFLYPVHDAPLDFLRWTRYGLLQAARKHGYYVEKELALGHPLECAALNTNIALSKTVMNWLQGKSIFALTATLLPFAILIINSLAWLGARLSKPESMMPHGYRMVWIKRQ